jgi:O-methyltransferase
MVLPDDSLNRATFEYVLFTDEDYQTVIRHDVHRTLSFVSPIPTWDPDLFALYEESLHHFEKKCDIRDFMDLAQLVRFVVNNRISGGIAEFGSYKGHSGYLMARLLEAMAADKKLYLFDTFESFPKEPLGIDEFWSGSHAVDFKSVTERFADFDFVTLVQGDFTRTFDPAGLDRLSLVYVDCDSARATQYLIHRIYPEILAPGGVMIFEDYGHPQLLGNRAVVNTYFQGRIGCLQFFSQFSGFYIVIKLPMSASAI